MKGSKSDVGAACRGRSASSELSFLDPGNWNRANVDVVRQDDHVSIDTVRLRQRSYKLPDGIVVVLGFRRREYLCELFRIGGEAFDDKVTGQRLRDFAYDLGVHIPIRAKTVGIATGICPHIH